jgi:hypothetical protein
MDALIPFTTSGSLVDLVDSTSWIARKETHSATRSGIIKEGRRDAKVQKKSWSSCEMEENCWACSEVMINSVCHVKPLPYIADHIPIFLPSFASIYRLDSFRRHLLLGAANFLLEGTVERLHYRLEYADRDIGESSTTVPLSARFRGDLFIFVLF